MFEATGPDRAAARSRSPTRQSGTITGTTSFSTSGSTGVIFTNYGSMSAGSTGPVLSVRGDGTGSGGGTFSFTNTSTGTITGTTSFSTSGSTGVIFTNYGSMSAGSTGPVLSVRGDGTGSGGGTFSFTNTSTGTITGTTSFSTSGSVGVIFTNYGSMSAGSTGPVLSVQGDGTGSGGGIFSFTNTSTGTITGSTVVSTSGSTGVIYTNYGSMSAGSTGPVLSIHGDGQGSTDSGIVFFNASNAAVQGDVTVRAQGGMSVAFENDGTISGGTPTTELGVSDDGTLWAANLGSIAGTWSVTGGANDDFIYQDAQGSAANITFVGGGGANTLVNEGDVGGITFDASATFDASKLNLLENTHAADPGAGGQPAIQMQGGAGPNALINFAGGTGFALNLAGGTSTDNLYNCAMPNLPGIQFESNGSPDRGVWTFTAVFGDVLQNAGDGVHSISYVAPDDSSPDFLLNSGNNIGSITMDAGFGFNLLSNLGSSVDNLSLLGTVPATNTTINPVAVLTSNTPDYDGLPAQANEIDNEGDSVNGIALQGGHGDVLFENSGADVRNVDVTAGDGAATFYNSNAGADLSGVTFVGGSQADVFQNDADGMKLFNVSTGGGDDVVNLRGDNIGNDATTSTIHLGNGDETFLSSRTESDKCRRLRRHG